MFLINLHESLTQIWANKLRSLLTVLGVIIGVAAIIVVSSTTTGFSNYINEFLLGMGTNAMWIQPDKQQEHFNKLVKMTNKDIESIMDLSIIENLAPHISRNAHVKLGNKELTTMITGTNSEFEKIRNWHVDLGRFFTPIEIKNRDHVCVLGRDVLKKLGANETIIGSNIYIDRHRYRVVGLLEEKGSFFGNSQDNVILIPSDTMNKIYPITRYMMGFMVSVGSPDLVESTKVEISGILRRNHNLSIDEPDDFRIFTQDEILKEFDRVNWIATGVLVGIVSISLLVGGVGIMNIMLVSVSERTREIGIRKAVGARDSDILSQFLTEAIVLSVFGGIIGIGTGYFLSFLVSLYPNITIEVKVPYWSILLGFCFAAMVGIVFGMIPAIKASRLQPIDALRYE